MILVTIVSLTNSLVNAKEATSSNILNIDFKPGKYKVGFKEYSAKDHSRSYARIYDETGNPVNDSQPRHMQIGVWYPAAAGGDQMTYQDYLNLNISRQTNEPKSKEAIAQQRAMFLNFGDKSTLEPLLDKPTMAYQNAPQVKGHFPLVLYTPREHRGIHLNHVMIEQLVSHGYIVVSTPSRSLAEGNSGTMPQQGFASSNLADFRFAKAFMHNFPNVNFDKVGIISLTAGASAGITLANTDYSVDAIVSLQGSIGTERINELQRRNRHEMLTPQNLRADLLHFNGKIWPGSQKSTFIKDAHYAERFEYDFNLQHAFALNAHFLVTFLQAKGKDISQDKKDYKQATEMTIDFLNQKLKNHSSSWLKKHNNKLIRYRAHKEPPSEKQFLTLLFKQNTQALFDQVEQIRKIDPTHKFTSGWRLNKLGYDQLDSENIEKALMFFRMNLLLYPDNANYYDSYAEALLKAGQEPEAKINYKKALELNPSEKLKQSIKAILKSL